MTTHLLVLALAAAVSMGRSQQGISERTDSSVLTQTADFGIGAPTDLAALAHRSDLIVVGRVTAGAVRTDGPKVAPEIRNNPLANMPQVYTEYFVEVSEILKRPAHGADVARVVRVGSPVGEAQWGQYTIKANLDGRRIVRAGDYVLFLAWSEEFQTYLFAPYGAFNIDGDTVEPLGDLSVATTQRGLAGADFVERVRQVVSGKLNRAAGGASVPGTGDGKFRNCRHISASACRNPASAERR